MAEDSDFEAKLTEVWDSLDPYRTIGILAADEKSSFMSFCRVAAADIIRDNPAACTKLKVWPQEMGEIAEDDFRELLIQLLSTTIAAGFALGHNWVSGHWTLWGG